MFWLGASQYSQQIQLPVCYAGFVQASGWPSVVAIMANWYGKGKRGLIMGLWNAHTSVGNMLVCSTNAFVWLPTSRVCSLATCFVRVLQMSLPCVPCIGPFIAQLLGVCIRMILHCGMP